MHFILQFGSQILDLKNYDYISVNIALGDMQYLFNPP